MSGGRGGSGFHLLDAAALVVGYGVASLLVRAYWPESGVPPVWVTLMILLVYTWLGLAMTGPVVLLIRRPAPPEPAGGVEAGAGGATDPDDEPPPPPRTWAELAWLIIGFYWIGLTILVVPVRMRGTRFLDSAVLGVFPVLAALALRFLGPRRALPPGDTSSWTHKAGVALLLAWPFAWVGLIVLGRSVM